MASPAQFAANQANSKFSTGPTSIDGKARSSQNATTEGLYANPKTILPGEESLRDSIRQGLLSDLCPIGAFETAFFDEIVGATLRLRRCTAAEANLDFIEDDEKLEKLERSIDRARSSAFRLLRQSTAELRRLQTERAYRLEWHSDVDFTGIGLAEFSKVMKSRPKPQKASATATDAAVEDLFAQFDAERAAIQASFIPPTPNLNPNFPPDFTNRTQSAAPSAQPATERTQSQPATAANWLPTLPAGCPNANKICMEMLQSMR